MTPVLTGRVTATAASPAREAASGEGFTYWALLVCLVIQHVQIGKQIPALESARPFLLAFVVVSVAWVVDLMSAGRRLVMTRQTWLVAAYVGLNGLSMLTAFNRGTAYDAFVLAWKDLVIHLVIVNVVDTVGKLKKVIYSVIAVHAYMALRGIVAYVREPSGREVVGAAFFLGDANDLAMVLVIVVPFTYFLLATHRTLVPRLALIVSGVSFVVATIFTSSRGGFIALGAVILYCVLSSRRKGAALGLTVLLAILVLVVAPGTFWERMQSIPEYEKDTSAMIRLEAWRAAREMALDHPLLGVGPGNFGHAKGMAYRIEGMPGENWNFVSSHSVYFGTVAELGLTGLALLFMILGSVVLANRDVRRRTREAPGSFLFAMSHGLEAAFLGFMVAGIFIWNAWQPVLWNNIAFTAVMTNLARRQAEALHARGAREQAP